MCFKYRKVADIFFAIENIFRFIACIHLNSASYNNDSVGVISTFMFNMMFYSTLNRCDMLINTPNFIWNLFIGINVAYNHPLTQGVVFTHILCVIFSFWGGALLNMILMYLAILSLRLKTAQISHLKLLNSMHEGVLILSHSTDMTARYNFLFCNKPAQRLINTFLGQVEECRKGNAKVKN